MRAAEKTQEAVLDALRTGGFYGTTGPAIHGVEVTDGDGRRATAARPRAVTLSSGRARGARANAGRLGYPNGAEILERDTTTA